MVNYFKFDMMKLFFLLLFMSFIIRCTDDDLSIGLHPYTGSQLKIDGYFYLKKDAYFYNIHFFYSNGVVLAAGGNFFSEAEMESYINKEFIDNKQYQKNKTSWGVFKIENNFIQFERWHPSKPPLATYIRSGEILNDTTFQITKSWPSTKEKNVSDENETYHFKKFSSKPDSTNSFVK